MSTTQNKALIERMFNEVMNNKDLSNIAEFISPSFEHRSMPTPVPGPQGFSMIIQQFFSAFPDMHINVQHVVAEDDKVATAGYWTGTNEGSLMGMPATGAKINIPFIDLWRFENGKAVENWVQMDNVALMQQLGHMPQPA